VATGVHSGISGLLPGAHFDTYDRRLFNERQAASFLRVRRHTQVSDGIDAGLSLLAGLARLVVLNAVA